MCFLSPQKLPVIDFSLENLKLGTSSWLATCKQVTSALEEYGCFMAVYDKVSLQLHNALFSVVEALFDLPLETKRKNVSDIPYFGYIENHPIIRPLYESFGLKNAATPEATQSFTNTMWPNGDDHTCATLLSHTTLVSQLEQMVIKMVFESYGLGHYYDSHKESTTYFLRMIKYGKPSRGESKLGCGTHADTSFLTLLDQNQVNGLEVKTKDSKWIVIEPMPSSFTVMAGQALLAWSNNRIHAPEHRVMISGNETRYSVGLFSHQKAIIKVPEELIDDEHPLQFKPFDHMGLVGYFYSARNNSAMKPTLKAYCGV